MALIHIDHVPESVKVNLPLNVIVPDPGRMKEVPVRQRKVLYLLHGLSDDASAWQRYSCVETFANQYGLVVIMPSVGRSMYIDQPNGQRYFTYLIDELPVYLEQVFGIPARRENTLIAGVSMGGYGAMKAAFLHPERFFAAASFSGVLSFAILGLLTPERKTEFEHLFGDLARVPGSQHDPATWIKTAASHPKGLPRLYVYAGRQEDVYPLSLQFTAACRGQGIAVHYHEAEGTHTWPYFNKQLQRFLAQVLKPIQ